MDTTQGIQRSTADRAPVKPGRHRPATQHVHEPAFPVNVGPNLYAIVLIDVASSARATSERLYRQRESLYDVVDRALKRRALSLNSFPLEDTGDGLRLLLPFDRVRPTDVIDTFVLGLLAELRLHRRYVGSDDRLRLRIAFDLGLVEPHLQGWAGDPLVRVARLVDAGPLRRLLRLFPGIDLAAVVSDVMYECVVRPAAGYIGTDCFRPVYVRVKEFDAWAWLLVPQAHWLYGPVRDAAA